MGDRTSVYLWVMKDDAESTSFELNGFHDINEYFDEDPQLDVFWVDEVNYGDLSIQDWALERGIPYSYRWENGSGYGSGYQHLRFDRKGKPVLIEYEDTDLELDPPEVAKLLAKADSQQDISKAYQMLHTFLKPFTEKFIPLAWETQEHNKRIARTINLISKT